MQEKKIKPKTYYVSERTKETIQALAQLQGVYQHEILRQAIVMYNNAWIEMNHPQARIGDAK